jgi:hypothetical protein
MSDIDIVGFQRALSLTDDSAQNHLEVGGVSNIIYRRPISPTPPDSSLGV